MVRHTWLRVRHLDIFLGSCLVQVLVMFVAVHPRLPEILYADLRMFLVLISCAGLGFAFQGRDSQREQAAGRWIDGFDAIMILAGAVLIPAALTMLTWTLPETVRAAPMAWESVFALGLTSFACTFAPTRTAVGITATVLTALSITRWINAGPRGARLALIHPESPPDVAWFVSAGMLGLGLIAVLVRRTGRNDFQLAIWLWIKAQRFDVVILLLLGQVLVAMAALWYATVTTDTDGTQGWLMVLGVVSATAAATVLAEQEQPRQIAAVRRTRPWTATAVGLCGAIPAASVITVDAFTFPGEAGEAVAWSILTVVGLTAVASLFLRVWTALGCTIGILVMAWIISQAPLIQHGVRYAVIHPDSPPERAWYVASLIMVLGVGSVALGKPIRRE